MQSTDRRIEGNFSQGWGVAAFIILLVAALWTTAFTIHKKTYRHPRDVTAPYRKEPTGFGGTGGARETKGPAS
jgi:hypothetical protein